MMYRPNIGSRPKYVLIGSAAVLLTLGLLGYFGRTYLKPKPGVVGDRSQHGFWRGGRMVMNPWHFAHSVENIEAEQQLVESLLHQIYAAPVEEQQALAQQLASEHKDRARFLWYEAYITGHEAVASAIQASGQVALRGGPGNDSFSQGIERYLDAAKEEIWEADPDQQKLLVEKFVEENPHDRSQLLFDAAVRDQAPIIEMLVNLGTPIHDEGQPSMVPMQAACFNGSLESAKILHAHGVSVDYQDEFGGSPLMRAASAGHIHIIEWLLANGADINLRDGSAHSMNALVFAAWNGQEKAAQLLIERGSVYHSRALSAAAWGGISGIFSAILEMSDFPRLPPSSGSDAQLTSDQHKQLLSALEFSGHGASPTIVRRILEYLVPSYTKDDTERANDTRSIVDALLVALKRTAQTNSVETAEVIIQSIHQHGLVGQHSGQVPSATLHDELDQLLPLCAEHGSLKLMNYLLAEQSVDVNAHNKPDNTTALYAAAHTGNVELIELLINEYGADIHKSSGELSNGPTALWKAINGGQESAARKLLELGGPVEYVDKALKSSSPRVFVAASKGYRAPVRLTTDLEASWFEKNSPVSFLCLEYPQGVPFLDKIQLRKPDEELKDERALRSPA